MGASAGINFVPIYGQSNSVGPTSELISSEDRPTAKMFVGGLHWQYTDPVPLDTAAMASATALHETENETVGLRETPSSGFADMLYQLAPSHVLHMANPGWSGATIAALAKGGVHFSRLVRECEWSAGLAGALNWECRAMPFIQGESDYALTRAQYSTAQQTLANDFAMCARSGRQERLPLTLVPQTCSHLFSPSATPTIALAQTDAAAVVGSLVRMACAMYPLDFVEWHMIASSSRWLGAYLAVAYYHLCILGETWTPLTITGAVRDSTGITVTCHVPVTPLVLDTTWVTALADGNAGFQVVDSAADPVTVTGVSLVDSTHVRLACSNGGGAGSVVRYGWAGTADETNPGRTVGARGNLRDSAGDDLTFEIEDGDVRQMHNWCLISEVATA